MSRSGTGSKALGSRLQSIPITCQGRLANGNGAGVGRLRRGSCRGRAQCTFEGPGGNGRLRRREAADDLVQ